jgi:hypothetical protein
MEGKGREGKRKWKGKERKDHIQKFKGKTGIKFFSIKTDKGLIFSVSEELKQSHKEIIKSPVEQQVKDFNR